MVIDLWKVKEESGSSLTFYFDCKVPQKIRSGSNGRKRYNSKDMEFEMNKILIDSLINYLFFMAIRVIKSDLS